MTDIPYLITDDIANELAAQTQDEHLSTGFEQRPYDRRPEGFYAPRYDEGIIPRSQWPDLIKKQEDAKSSAWHVEKSLDLPHLFQNGFGYCWCYGLTNAVQNRYGANGHRIHLSAFGLAYQIKNGRNQGGWAGEAVAGVEKFGGIPTDSTWPNLKKDMSLSRNPDVKADAARHGIVEFRELPKNNFDAAASVLLRDGVVTLGLSWWGHLVCGVRLVKVGNGYGIVIKNSWGTNWGDEGFGTLPERKAIAHEYIQVVQTKVRAA